MDVGWPRSRSYAIGSGANWAAFLLAVFLLTWGSETGRLPAFAIWAVIAILAASVAAQFVAAYRLIAAQDEFVRGVAAKRGIAAAGLTITVAVLWGLAEQFLGASDVPMWVVYPFFWGALGIVTPFIGDSRP